MLVNSNDYMIVSTPEELVGLKAISHAVAKTYCEMKAFAKAGVSTLEIDLIGKRVLESFGAHSAPKTTYDFPGYTCISVNNVFAHGIPTDKIILKDGDIVNIDVSAELNGFWSDNGGTFIIGEDKLGLQPLINSSRTALYKVLEGITEGSRIAVVGRTIEQEAKSKGFQVIKNLTGHGVGRSLHEDPEFILNYYEQSNHTRFLNNCVVAIETFVSTKSDIADQLSDGWSLVGNKGGYCAQFEHTILITENKPVILTSLNGI